MTDAMGEKINLGQAVVARIARFVRLDSVNAGTLGNYADLRSHKSSKEMFGKKKIDDKDILFGITREPALYRVTFGVARDAFDNWFKLVTDDKTLNDEVQRELARLGAKMYFIRLCAFERAFGYAVLVMGLEDDGETNADPAENVRAIRDLAVYSKMDVQAVTEDKDLDSVRYMLPETYKIDNRVIHFSRVLHAATFLVNSLWEGTSQIYPIYDDSLGFRLMRYGVYRAFVRYGSGFPDVTLKGAKIDTINKFIASGQFDALNADKYFVHNETQSLEFKGDAANAINPTPYYDIAIDSLSVGTGIPGVIFKGAQAGALTGSEVNERAYFKIISDVQTAYEGLVRNLVDLIIMIKRGVDADKIPEYKIEWTGQLELSEKDKAEIENLKADTAGKMTSVAKIDEVRKRVYDLPPLPDKAGDVVPGLAKPTAPAPAQPVGSETQIPPGVQVQTDAGAGGSDIPTIQEKLAADLRKLLTQAIEEKMTGDQMTLAASLRIEEHITAMKKVAKLSLSNKVGRPISDLPPEMEKQFIAMKAQYLGDFKRMLADAQALSPEDQKELVDKLKKAGA